MASGDLVKRIYGGFRGVDFRGDDINISRSPDSLNVWKDYKETERITTRPKMKLLMDFDEPVYGIFFYNNKMLVHSGTTLYQVDGETKTEIYKDLKATRSNSFIFNNLWFFMDGKNYLQYDGETIKEVEGYTPTTSINRKPNGGGTLHEDVNLLSDWRINTFVGDGNSTKFYLDTKDVSSFGVNTSLTDWMEAVKINGVFAYGNGYTFEVNEEEGFFTITPAPPDGDGNANVSIKFKKKSNEKENKIKNCTLLQVFDNRVFFSGNPDYPNMMWHSSLNDPTYCSDYDYYNEGLDTAKVKGMVAGNNALWVFKEPSQANTTVFYHTPTIDSEYGKIYPNSHSSISIGCVGKAINFNDDIVFFSDRGMEGISGDITSEQVIAHRSSLVDNKLVEETSENSYKNMILEEWEGYLLVVVGSKAYLADSRSIFTNENHIEYEWYYWSFPRTITCTRVYDGELYLGTKKGIYTLTKDKTATGSVKSYWVTPKDKFNNPQYAKTTNKRGCVVEAEGDITVYVKTDKLEDFVEIGKYENIEDYFVSRIKQKKFKDIQLKFESNTGFSLETATLECFIGGYIKR